MHRRRFLAVCAAFLATPARAVTAPAVWTGSALGAAARITLLGADPATARRLFHRVEAEVARIEAHFSLHRDSALTRLNRDGRLAWPEPEMTGLFTLSGRVHAATGGVFDPTIQPLWLATATAGDIAAARALIGWQRVGVSAGAITLAPGMALTFNGIAQGHAADRIAALMRAEGFGDVLIDMGEIMALGQRKGRPWQAAIASPDGVERARTGLCDRALATSSPMGTLIGDGRAHILHPSGLPARWSTVSVSARDAATADALSTAFCLMDRAAIDRALDAFPGTALEYLG